MKLFNDNLKIELENQQEIRDFWNIITFALDFHELRDAENWPCMNESELKLAKNLQKVAENMSCTQKEFLWKNRINMKLYTII